MTAGEASEFESNPYHLDILRMRSFDEAAKVPGRLVPGLRDMQRNDECKHWVTENLTQNHSL